MTVKQAEHKKSNKSHEQDIDRIYILLPVHNRIKTTQKIIECLQSQTNQNFHLILIDDGSTDGTAAMVSSKISNLTIITGDGNLWWAGCLQKGYKWLKRKDLSDQNIVLIINDDTEFGDNFLETALVLMRQNNHALILSECYSKRNNKLVDKGIHIDWENFTFDCNPDQEKINCLSTTGLFIKYQDFMSSGGFRPQILPHYASDLEFTFRAYQQGKKLITHPSLKLCWDDTETGYRSFRSGNFWKSLQNYFSKKSAINPITWTKFVILSCPWPWKIQNLIRIWLRSIKYICLE